MKFSRFFCLFFCCVFSLLCSINLDYEIDKISDYDETVSTSTLLTTTQRDSEPKFVILGGDVLGFSYTGDGVLVVANEGLGIKNEVLEVGDIIKSIDDIPVVKVADIGKILSDSLGQEVRIKLRRDGSEIERRLKPSYDVISK